MPHAAHSHLIAPAPLSLPLAGHVVLLPLPVAQRLPSSAPADMCVPPRGKGREEGGGGVVGCQATQGAKGLECGVVHFKWDGSLNSTPDDSTT